jgi:signal transduction histidine kinase
MDRLLEKLQPKQRHLAFLVGLLMLTFVLTVMLAFKAHRSEIARQQQAQAVLHDLSASMAQEWARYVVEFGGDAMKNSLAAATRVLIRDRHMDLAEFAALADSSLLCAACENPPAHAFFSLDPTSGRLAATGPDPLPAALHASVYAQIRAGDMAAVSDSVSIGLAMIPVGGAVGGAVTLYRTGAGGEVVRAVGYYVPPAVLQEFFAVIFEALTVLPRSMARGAPNSAFFDTRLTHGPLTVLTTSASEGVYASSRVDHGAFADATFHVGTRENAAAQLLVDGPVTSGVPLLLTLLFAICGLIVLALILVRREAELVRLRADFISGVSHELRTPLAQIRMFTETLLLNRVRSDVERRRSLEIIDQEARRLTHLVENVLLFSKSEGGRKPGLAPEPTDLAAEIRRAAESFGPMCRTRDVTLRTELQDGITVAVDRGALRQIMVNLLDNALKYGPAGQRVTVGVALFDSAGRVWVDDEGPGIPAADRERVFDSFYRLPRDVESRSSGSGIGLAVVRELARLHGGEAWAEDAPGGGARIVVQFPDAWLRAQPPAEFAAAS